MSRLHFRIKLKQTVIILKHADVLPEVYIYIYIYIYIYYVSDLVIFIFFVGFYDIKL